MNVYVLTASWDYEGEAVIGVYSTKEKAEEAHRRTEGQGDERLIHEVELDGVPERWLIP